MAKSSTKNTKPLAKSQASSKSSRPTPTPVTKKATQAVPMPAKKDSKSAAPKAAAKATVKPEPKNTKQAAPAKAAAKGKAAASSSAVSEALEAKLVKLGKARGILTYDDLNKHLPADEFSPEVIDELITRLAAKGVKVIELPDVDDKVDVPFVETDGDEPVVVEGGEMVIEMESEKEEESYGRSDDPELS